MSEPMVDGKGELSLEQAKSAVKDWGVYSDSRPLVGGRLIKEIDTLTAKVKELKEANYWASTKAIEAEAKCKELEEYRARALRLHHVMCDCRDYGIERRNAAEGKLLKAREAWMKTTTICQEPECIYDGNAYSGDPPEWGPCGKCWACEMSQALAKDDDELRLEEMAEKAKREEENGGPEF